MSEKLMKKSRLLLAALLGIVAVSSLSMWGCGTSGYDDPADAAVTTRTDTALIDAAKLKEWMDAGLVNKTGGFDRVVILDVSADLTNNNGTPDIPGDDFKYNKYNTVGHIPGAYLIQQGNAYFQAVRAEGPLSATGAMVCDGATMDSLIQNAGIDKYTTVVLTTTSTSALDLTRAYATFRYWGLPKNRIKVLQGANAAYSAVAPLTTSASTIAKSTWGIAQNGTNVNTDMRVSLGEMISSVKDIVAGNANKIYIIDTVRGGTVSKTPDLIDVTKFTPFDGAVKGSYFNALANVVTGVTFKTADEIKAYVSAAMGSDGTTPIGDVNRDSAKTLITMCRAGNNASQAYFVLDGIAYYNSDVAVKWYDGSLGQWNLMASSDHLAVNGTNAGGKLAVGSIWDTSGLMDNLTWNVDRALPIIDYGTRVFTVEPNFAEGNQIETADKAYRSPVTGPSGGGASSGGGGC